MDEHQAPDDNRYGVTTPCEECGRQDPASQAAMESRFVAVAEFGKAYCAACLERVRVAAVKKSAAQKGIRVGV